MPYKRADAIHLASKASSIVSIPRQAEMGVVEMAIAIVFIVRVQGRVDDAANGGLSLCIRRCDLDLLEAENMGPIPSLEVCAE